MKNCENIHLILPFHVLIDPRTYCLQRNVRNRILHVTYKLLTMVLYHQRSKGTFSTVTNIQNQHYVPEVTCFRPHLHLVPRLRRSGAPPLLPIWWTRKTTSSQQQQYERCRSKFFGIPYRYLISSLSSPSNLFTENCTLPSSLTATGAKYLNFYQV
jgi:hypothetical protein